MRDPFDIFAEVFGNLGGFGGFGRGGRAGPRCGNDLRTSLEISFEEAAFGTEKDIEVRRQELCPACDGLGAEPGTSPETCPECRGSGQTRQVQHTLLGSFGSIHDLPALSGERDCRQDALPRVLDGGSGRVYINRHIEVNIPAGVDDGITIRVSGQGEPGELNGPTATSILRWASSLMNSSSAVGTMSFWR